MVIAVINHHPSIFIIGEPSNQSIFFLRYFLIQIMRKLKSVLWLSLLIIIQMNLVGCLIVAVPIHSPGNDPFPEEKYSFIIPGSTDKSTIKKNLFDPWAHRLGGKIFIYAAGQLDSKLVGLFAARGYGKTFEVPRTYFTHLLIIEFDKNDVVSAVEKFSGDAGELKSGLYVVKTGGYAEPLSPSFLEPRRWHFSRSQLILRASQIVDEQAKQFNVPHNKSAIYYYKNFSDELWIVIDNTLSVDPGSDGFLLWLVSPGDHTISTRYGGLNPEKLTIRCNPGEVYYVEHSKGVLREEQKFIAEKEILKRKLILDEFDIFESN
jgi:hypothetical protein